MTNFGLLTPGVGWVFSGSGVYVTRTGGRTWDRVKAIGADAELSGASSAGPGQLVLSLADGGQVHRACSSVHGNCESMSAASPGTSSSQRGQIVVTGDAGRSWRSRGFTGPAIPASASFIGNRNGFVLGYTPAAHHAPRASLYETRDGARTWSRIAAVPFTGLLSFANGRDGLGGGWAMGAGLVDGAAIYRTSDGGRSWTRTSLCRSATVYACEAPHLFAGGRGVVLATARDQRSGSTEVDVYTTANDGVSWTRHTLPHIPALTDDPIYIPFSAPNADDLFAWVSPYLYTSVDGGATWSRRAEPALTQRGLQPVFSNIAFIDRDYGWYANIGLFLYTTDGGRRWIKIGR